jgi:SAM-dependent methyltransferase
MSHIALANPSATRCFVDSHGNAHAILPGLSDSLFMRDKPRHAMHTGYSEDRAGYMRGVRSRVQLGSGLVRTLRDRAAPESPSPDILVVGAGDGAECVWLQTMESATVSGVDLRTDGVISQALLSGATSADPAAAPDPDRIRLMAADITHPNPAGLIDQQFDAVYSWQTFEHIMDPAAAMQTISTLLRPGGLAFIEYNPFYSIDGAHWCATIDIPWAHARFDHTDLERAINTLHPGRPDWSAPFVRDRINRMTHADLLKHAAMAGLELKAFLPRVRTEDVMLLDPDTLEAIRRMDDRPTIADLTSRMVRVVFRKP